ncbi:MAG: hypothetical protein HKO95_15785 [Rhodobacteraceae bacterium]|nr:hypothetical protein [Alphaproteobacteria bacterium]MBT8474517.1 hypothetical protein [Alphaproteobacteria bacterium]NNK68187.1 hypothetical protein [Paracoccaceae bacterium]
MNRIEFIIATAIVLFVAFMLGWFAYWLLHKLTKVNVTDIGEFDRMAQSLHDAEEAREQAISYMQQREAELTNRLAQTEAELKAAMEGLRDSRREADELRTYIESVNQAG